EHQTGVTRSPVVLPYVAAAKPGTKEVEDLRALGVLADTELWDELVPNSRARVPLHGYMKRALAVDEAGEVRVQPFLLIVRTDRIVTAWSHALNNKERV